jgi:restriction endonuclease S subunit
MAVWTSPHLIETYLNRRIDSEFFDPAYIKAENETLQCHTENLGRLGNFVPGPFGSAFHVQNYDFKSPYRYIRGKDVKPFFLLDDDNRYVPEGDFKRLSKYSVLPHDLMISVVGTLGNVSICTEDDTPAVFSCKSTIFRSREVEPYYLLVYLNSHFGRMCLLRRQRGAVQTGLNIEDLRAVPVPRFGDDVEREIANLVQSSHFSAKKAKASYTQAQQLLESELGLDKLRFDKPAGYTARFSELELSRRADAEFFHVKYDPFLTAAKNYHHGCSSLRSQTTKSFPNFDARKQHGDFQYIEIGDISISNGSYSSNILPVDRLPANAKIRLSGGEILVSQVRPNRGAIAIVNDFLGRETICSGAFYVCTANDINRREIIWLYLRCMRNVFEKFCGGTSYPTIDSRYLSQFPVPFFPDALAEKIRELVITSKEAAQKSEQLLDQAKSRVEQLIEKAVQA